MAYNPSERSSDKPDYSDDWRRQGKQLVDHDMKEGRMANNYGLQGIGPNNRFPDLNAQEEYDVIDVGGTDWAFDETLDTPYNAIQLATSGTVEVKTTSGDVGELHFQTGDTIKVSVAKVLSGNTSVSANQITLLR